MEGKLAAEYMLLKKSFHIFKKKKKNKKTRELSLVKIEIGEHRAFHTLAKEVESFYGIRLSRIDEP